MPTIGSTASITGDDNTTEGRARRLYTEILADIHSKGVKTRSTPHGIGYLWNGNLTTLASKCWPNLTISPGRTGPASKQFLEHIKKYLRESKNVIWVQERGQFYVSPDYKEARVSKKAAARNVPVATKPTPGKVDLAQESITDRAKRIWERAQQACEAANAPTETYGNVDFWVCDKPLAFWIKAEFPELCLPAMETQPNFEKYKRPLYDLLRATTNCVNIGSKYDQNIKDGEHHWLIRKEWHDSHEAFENVFHIEPEVEPEPEPEPVVEEPVQPLVVESVEKVEDAPLDPHMALARLLEVVSAFTDLQTENEMLEAENSRLNVEVNRLSGENDTLQTSIEELRSGDAVVSLIEEVLASIYEGNIGMSRAIADVEDIIRVSKSTDGS